MVESSAALYLLIGKERFLKSEFIADLRTKLFPDPSYLSLNFQEFQADKHSLNEVFDFVRTSPFLSEKRLAVLWDIDELDAEQKEDLVSRIEGLPRTAALVLVSESTNAKKENFLNKLSLKARLVTCHTPFEKDLPSWIQNRLKVKGVGIDSAALVLLTERAGRDLADLDQAFERLELFIHPRKTIEAQDVQLLLGRSAEEDVFQLIDDLVQRKPADALKRISRLLGDGERAFEIVAVLASGAEKLWKTSCLLEQGLDTASIARELKGHPFYVEKIVRQARGIKPAQALNLLKQILACDESVKKGVLADKLALERLCLTAV